MKKKIIFMIAICVLVVFVHTACTSDISSEPSSSPEATPLEVESPVGDISVESELPTEDNVVEYANPEQTEIDDIKEQMAGNWVFHEANPEHSALVNLFTDSRWEKPPNFGGSFWIASEEAGVYSLRLTIEHSAILGVDLGFEYDEYIYDALNDRLGMIVHSSEGSRTLWFARE